MMKKVILYLTGILISLIIGSYSYQWLKQVAYPSHQLQLRAEFYNTSNCDENTFDFRYSTTDDYPQTIMEYARAESNNNRIVVTFHLPENFQAKRFEINFGNCASSKYIKQLSIINGDRIKHLSIEEIEKYFEPDNHTASFVKTKGLLYAEVNGLDGGIVTKAGFDVKEWLYQPVIIRPYLYAFFIIILIFSVWHYSVFTVFPQSGASRNNHNPTWNQVGLIVLFILLLFSTLVFKAMNVKEVDDEQRSKKGFPKITPTSFLSYTPKLNGFLDDHFGGRSLIIAGNALLKKNVFHVSPNRNLVELGKENFLFFVDEKVGALTENKEPYTRAQLEQFRITLMEKKEWLKLKGISFYLMIPPISQHVYPELLPESYKVYHHTPKTIQLLTYLRKTTDIKIIDLYNPMLKLKKLNRLYQKHDTHWNASGAYVGYYMMISQIRKDYPEIGFPAMKEELSYSVVNMGKGDCERLIGIPYDSMSLEVNIQRKDQPASSYEDTSTQVVAIKANQIPLYWKTFTQKNNTLPRLFMYHDSYAMQLTDLFPHHFGHTTMVWNKLFNPNEIEAVKPDIVVIEAVERFVPFLGLSNPIRIKRELRENGIHIK